MKNKNKISKEVYKVKIRSVSEKDIKEILKEILSEKSRSQSIDIKSAT